ncbi:MAG: hypothetical protein ACI8QZ_003456 [Chlamydiales bacterium]|jgi:hypothetical protein
MESLKEDGSFDAPARARAGPLLFVLSLVCALFMWSRQRPGAEGLGARAHSAPALPDRAGVEGWAGTSGSLHARLMPLHADAARQRLDASALERRLGLGPGQPWRLLVTYLPHGETVGEPVAIAGWSVADPEGLALVPIVGRPAGGGGSGVTDPLRSLLSAPNLLEPGHEVSLVLWGRAPIATEDEAPRIVEAQGGALAGGRTWILEARHFASAPAQPSLARAEHPARPIPHLAPGLDSAMQTPQ